MPLADDYRRHNEFYRAYGSTARRLERVQALLNLITTTILEKHTCEVSTNDYTQLTYTYTINGYNGCWQRKLPSMPSQDRMLCHPDGLRQCPTPRYRRYECSTGWQVGCGICLGVDISRNCGPRLGSGGKLSIEHCLHLVLLFSSLLPGLLLWITAQYKWRRHRFYYHQISVTGRSSVTVGRISRIITLSDTNR